MPITLTSHRSFHFRTVIAGAFLTLIASAPAVLADDLAREITTYARSIEQRLDARVGVAVYDIAEDRLIGHGADDRFPMTSTFKVLACAALLDSDLEEASTVEIRSADILDYAPVTSQQVGEVMSPYQLCEITMRTSDNTAANLVLEELGGPEAVTNFLRLHGDEVTRLDRWEPDLNEGQPGDPRDTTTPRAIAMTLAQLTLGGGLQDEDSARLVQWLKSNEVAAPLLRAGIPSEWQIGDRSGAGGQGSRGIVALVWPEEEKPLSVALYLTETDASIEERNLAIAEFGELLGALYSK